MTTVKRTVDEGFDRLQEILVAMRPGDTLVVADASQLSGLTEHLCRAVLEGLVRAGLMNHTGTDVFVRCRLVSS